MDDKKRNFIIAACCYVFAVVGLILARILFFYVNFGNDTFTEIFSSVLIQVVIIAGIPLTVTILLRRPRLKKATLIPYLKETGFQKPKPIVWVLSVVLGFAFYFATMGLAQIGGIALLIFGYTFGSSSPTPTGIQPFIVSLFCTAVLAGICEETLNRGIIIKGFRPVMSEKKVIFLTALMFSLLHGNIGQTFYTFFGGLVFAYITVKTKSLYPAMIVHFMNNAQSVYFSHASANGWAGGQIYDFIDSMFSNYFLLLVMLWLIFVFAVVALCFAIRLLSDPAGFTAMWNRSFYTGFGQVNPNLQNPNASPVDPNNPVTTVDQNSSATVSINADSQGASINQEASGQDTKENLENSQTETSQPVAQKFYNQRRFKIDVPASVVVVGGLLLAFFITIFTYFWGL